MGLINDHDVSAATSSALLSKAFYK